MLKRQDKTILTKLRVSDSKKKVIKKSLLTLLTEYLLDKDYQVNQVGFSNQEKLTNYKDNFSISYQITNKKGIDKGSFTYLKEIDVILVPFISDSIIISCFNSLTKIQQKKVYFLPSYKSEQQSKQPKTKTDYQIKTRKQVTFALNINIIQQAENFLQSKWEQDDYTYSSLSTLIRASLQAYQQGKINLVKLPITKSKNNPKKDINLRLDEELLEFYQSLPNSQRVKFVERSLLSYLSKI